MPYITQAERDLITAGKRPENVGHLNYCLTMELLNSHLSLRQIQDRCTTICQQYINDKSEIRYQLVNDVIGAITCCKLELRRRHPNAKTADFLAGGLDRITEKMYRDIAAPYEDKKIIENGDVEPYKT